MNILLAMLAGLAGGAVSATVGYVAAVLILQSMGVRDREGAIGYAGIFFGIIAGIAGLILSVAVTLRWRTGSAGSALVQSPVALAGIAALAAVGLYAYYQSVDQPIATNSAPPILSYELQAPDGAKLPPDSQLQIRLQAGKTRAEGWWDKEQPGSSDGSPVLFGHLELYLKTSDRMLELALPGAENYLWNLKLPASPLGSKYKEWSKWYPADYHFTAESNNGKRIPADKAYKIRYRVEAVEH